MRILVTGSEGTLGRPLVKELRRRGHEVTTVDIVHSIDDAHHRVDIADYRQLHEVFQGFASQHFEYVYHLAAEFGRHNGERCYETLWRTNVIGTRNVLECQREHLFRLIFASSSEIYGEITLEDVVHALPFDIETTFKQHRAGMIKARKHFVITEHMSDVAALRQRNDYAISKWVNELQIGNFQDQQGAEVMMLRLFNAYGPGEWYHQYRSVVCLFCYRALKDLPYTVFQGYSRVFMFVDDLIRTMANACEPERFVPGSVYNIGGTEYTSVANLSRIILECLGKDDRHVKYLPQDEHNVVSKRPDIAKAVRDLGHDPKVTLHEGIPKTIEWMKGIYNAG